MLAEIAIDVHGTLWRPATESLLPVSHTHSLAQYVPKGGCLSLNWPKWIMFFISSIKNLRRWFLAPWRLRPKKGLCCVGNALKYPLTKIDWIIGGGKCNENTNRTINQGIRWPTAIESCHFCFFFYFLRREMRQRKKRVVIMQNGKKKASQWQNMWTNPFV